METSVLKSPFNKRDSNTGVFLWILQNFWEQLLYRTTLMAASGDVSKTIKSDRMKINCLNPASVNGCNA